MIRKIKYGFKVDEFQNITIFFIIGAYAKLLKIASEYTINTHTVCEPFLSFFLFTHSLYATDP